jgi:hypothetical protein
MLRLVLCGCEPWSLTWGEKGGLTVFGNRLLREIFGHNRDVVTGEWRRLHNEELCDLYCSRNSFRVLRSRRRWAEYGAQEYSGQGGT